MTFILALMSFASQLMPARHRVVQTDKKLRAKSKIKNPEVLHEKKNFAWPIIAGAFSITLRQDMAVFIMFPNAQYSKEN